MKPLHSQRIKQNQRILLISKKTERRASGGWLGGKGERECRMGGCESREDSEEDSEEGSEEGHGLHFVCKRLCSVKLMHLI